MDDTKPCEQCGTLITRANPNFKRQRFCSFGCWKQHQADALPARFWSKVDQTGGSAACWPWLGSRNRKGYGQFGISSGVMVGAHRQAFRLAHGEFPVGLVCHRCDNPPCCNPAHLYAGTAADNYRDAVDRGRHRNADITLT